MGTTERLTDDSVANCDVTNMGFGIPRAPGVSASPEATISYIRSQHVMDELLDTPQIDALLLGKSSIEFENDFFATYDVRAFKERYPKDQPWICKTELAWTSYKLARLMVRELTATGLSEKDTLYDLGSGYGRVVLYAGITTEATCKGIEMVSERAAVAQRAKDRLKLGKVDFINGNVLDQDYFDGSVFFTYTPFSPETLEQVLLRLKQVADMKEAAGEKPITIVSHGDGNCYRRQPWLELTNKIEGRAAGDRLTFFKPISNKALPEGAENSSY